MKLHDLQPAPGSTKKRMRVGRGISAGKGKTAGRGTKGQRSRAGASIPAWFEGGQTPIHVRVPKLRGFKRRERIEYQVVNVGRIAEYAAAGRFGEAGGKDPLTVNGEVLASAGLIRHAERPLKVLGQGDVEIMLFVAADAFTGTARAKIEAAGGFVQVLAPAPGTPTAEASTSDDATEVAAAGNDGAPRAADETPEVPQASARDDSRDDAESGSATE